MFTVVAISAIIIAIVIILAVVTTSKAYTYKHTVDSMNDSKSDDHLVAEMGKGEDNKS